jgi:hypothetical protein
VLAGSVSHFIAILLQFTLPASNGGEGASLAFQG